MFRTECSQQSVSVNDNRSLTWYLVCRTAVITFLLGGAAIFYLKGSLRHISAYPLFILIAVSYAEALASVFFLIKIKNTNFFAQIQIVWDLVFVTALIVLSGGVESIFSFAYLLIIVSASFLLSRRQTILAASGAVVLFGGLLDLQFFNYLEPFGLYRAVADGTFFTTLFVHSVAFLLSALLSGTLAERWRKSEAQLERKRIDFDELEKMNRTILAHINSGLMLINMEGEIRSFNRAASDITDLSLEEVYGLKAKDVFSDLLDFVFLDGIPVNRSEGVFVKKSGEIMILGYATTPAKGSHGEKVGTLITFQDLTQLKKIEEELKRADRLAAVGRLAASMAHEIRNPLASISGSVQLLLENSHAQKEDQDLMNIVVNEADRLNGLLTSFLHFAKPRPPEKETVAIAQLIGALIVLLNADKRFDKVAIEKMCSDKIVVNVDSQQIQQILWDLAVNAEEAMQGEGILKFTVVENNPSTIIVEDSGPGIPEKLRNRIFEPFFSTKENGTGLGLASVYSVVDAHGGNVSVGQSTFGGARFSLNFIR
jgi:two-component system, NtrC family, sensor histidine kinase PilS